MVYVGCSVMGVVFDILEGIERVSSCAGFTIALLRDLNTFFFEERMVMVLPVHVQFAE